MQPDIEIYILSCPTERIIRWLEQDFAVTSVSKVSDTATKVFLEHDGKPIPVTILEQAAGKKFTSVWFDSAGTPWADDMTCAKHAHQNLNCEVRCNFQGWSESEEQDPDLWWRINDKDEGPFIWR